MRVRRPRQQGSGRAAAGGPRRPYGTVVMGCGRHEGSLQVQGAALLQHRPAGRSSEGLLVRALLLPLAHRPHSHVHWRSWHTGPLGAVGPLPLPLPQCDQNLTLAVRSPLSSGTTLGARGARGAPCGAVTTRLDANGDGDASPPPTPLGTGASCRNHRAGAANNEIHTFHNERVVVAVKRGGCHQPPLRFGTFYKIT